MIPPVRLSWGPASSRIFSACTFAAAGAPWYKKKWWTHWFFNVSTTLANLWNYSIKSVSRVFFQSLSRLKFQWKQEYGKPFAPIPSRCSFPNTKQFCIGSLINFDFYWLQLPCSPVSIRANVVTVLSVLYHLGFSLSEKVALPRRLLRKKLHRATFYRLLNCLSLVFFSSDKFTIVPFCLLLTIL